MPDTLEKQRRRELLQTRRREDLQKKREEARNFIKNQSTGNNKDIAKNKLKQPQDIMRNLDRKKPWKNIRRPLGTLNLLSLRAYMSFGTDWTYAFAGMAALIKDIIDPILLTFSSFLTWSIIFAIFGGLVYAILLVITIMASIIICMMMILSSIMEKKNNFAQKKIIRAYLILLLTTAIEFIPGLNILPLETLTVFIIYIMALQDRKRMAKSE